MVKTCDKCRNTDHLMRQNLLQIGNSRRTTTRFACDCYELSGLNCCFVLLIHVMTLLRYREPSGRRSEGLRTRPQLNRLRPSAISRSTGEDRRGRGFRRGDLVRGPGAPAKKRHISEGCRCLRLSTPWRTSFPRRATSSGKKSRRKAKI